MKKLLQISLLFLFAAPAFAQESSAPKEKVLRTYDWKDLSAQIPNSEIISMDGISTLKIENTNNMLNKEIEVLLLTVTNSSLIKKANTIEWEMKYNMVWANRWANLEWIEKYAPAAIGGDNITNRGLIEFAGTNNWNKYERGFELAPYNNETPFEVEFKLYMPSAGTVYLRPIKLLENSTSSNWWSPQQGGMVGGIGGAIIGCFGGLIGLLASRGKARRFVLAMTKIFIALGILSLIAGGIAAATKQPYAVYYPLLLAGFILTIVFSVNLPSIQRRYDELEIRRMTSIDTMGN